MTDNRAEEIKTLARDYAELAIMTCVAVASDEGEKGNARVAAARELLARGFGAPERKLEASHTHRLIDEREAHLAALQEFANRKSLPPPADTNIVDAKYKEIKDGKATKDKG